MTRQWNSPHRQRRLTHKKEKKENDYISNYRTMKRKIDIAKEEILELVQNKIRNDITFYTRCVKFGSIEVRLQTKELAEINVTKILRTNGFFFPTYLKKRITRIRVGKVPPEIEEEWLAVTVLCNKSNEIEILEVSKTQMLNWWALDWESLC